MAKVVKKAGQRTAKVVSREPRLRKLSRKQARTADKQKVAARPLLTSQALVRQTFGFLYQHWRILGGIILVYLILNVVFASGISNLNNTISGIKDNLSTGQHKFVTALGGFSGLLGTAGASGSATGSTLQTFLIILESLIIIWALRQLIAGQTIGVKQAYYQATGQLVPFLLILGVLFIQFLPITVGATVLNFILGSTLLNTSLLVAIFTIIFIGLVAWTVYTTSASIFALYIVTLPEMTPMVALRSAKNLVKFRRVKVIRRLIFLPLFIFMVAGVIIIPLILYANFLVLPVFYALSMVGILFVHSYLYGLYRELLK